MNKFLTTVSITAILIGLSGAAYAQNLSNTIGQPLIEQMSDFETGNYINRSINNADINGSVNITGAPNTANSTIFTGAIDIGFGSTEGLQASFINGTAAAVSTAETLNRNLKADISYTTASSTGGAIIKSTDEIKTVAAGAINTGHIATAVSLSSGSTSDSRQFDVIDFEYLDGELSQASASTANTAASASAADGEFASLGSLSSNVQSAASLATSGPAAGVYAVNEAFNTGSIDASVNIFGNGTDLTGISTVAAGSLNTGSISLGFDGAALNAAINSGGQ